MLGKVKKVFLGGTCNNFTWRGELIPLLNIAEAVEDSNKRPEKTLFCVLRSAGGKEFDRHQLKSLEATARIIRVNGAATFDNLHSVASWVNSTS